MKITPSVQSFFTSGTWKSSKSSQVGLLIGVPSHVVHVSPTIPQSPSSGGGGGDANNSSNNGSSSSSPVSLTTVRPSALTHHTRSLLPLLPGNSRILGLYSIDGSSSPVTLETANNLLSSLKSNLEGKFKNFTSLDGGVDLVHLHYDYKAGKITINKKEVEVDGDVKLAVVECDVELGGVFSGADGGLEGIVDGVINEWKDILSNSTTFLFSSPKNSETLDLPSSSTPYDDSTIISILFSKMPLNKQENHSNSEFSHNFHFRGTTHLCCVIKRGDSTEVVEKSLKSDLLRTLTARLQLHCESLIEEDTSNETEKGVVFHELPRRVLYKDFLVFCDYLFPGEGPNDCIESLEKVAGVENVELGKLVEVETEVGESGCGDFFSPLNSSSSSSMEHLLQQAENSISKMDSKHGPLVVIGLIVIGVLVAVVAILVGTNSSGRT